MWRSVTFLGISLASGFFCSQTESTLVLSRVEVPALVVEPVETHVSIPYGDDVANRWATKPTMKIYE